MASPIQTVLPESSPGLVNYRRETGGADQYGTESTINALVEAGYRWFKKHPDIPFSIGDISRKGGGHFPGHGSHQKGVDADVRPLRKDGRNLPVAVFNKEYSQDLTRDLIKTIRESGLVELVLFNDRQLISEGLCRYYSGHVDHLHFRFRDVAMPQLRTLKKGMSGKDVRELTNALVLLDYLPSSLVGDEFTEDVDMAVRMFQTTHKLNPIDGKVGKDTRAALSTALKKKG